MSTPRATAITLVCLWAVFAILCCPPDAAAASRSSGGSHSVRSSVSGSRGPVGGTSTFRQAPYGYRGAGMRSRGVGSRNERPVFRSPIGPSRSERVGTRRYPEPVRVSPSTSRHPVVRDPAISVGRTTHPGYSYTTPRTRYSYYPYYRSYPYYPYYPYYSYYPNYYFGLTFGYPWYSYYRPWYWCSWYDPWGWYPYYYGWWDGWRFGGAWYYCPSYDYLDYPPVEVTERVVRSSTPPDYASAGAEQAKEWFEKGRYGDAAEVYRRLNVADEDDLLAGLAHAHCLLADERYEYAAYVVRKTIGQDPDLAEVFLHLRGYYLDWGVFVNQVVKLERYVHERPGNTSARFLLGYAYLFWDRSDDAASVFRGLLNQEPQDLGARSLLRLAEDREDGSSRAKS